ncbi:formylglycine-generating enzyme family protein [Methylolobus aquaticus]
MKTTNRWRAGLLLAVGIGVAAPVYAFLPDEEAAPKAAAKPSSKPKPKSQPKAPPVSRKATPTAPRGGAGSAELMFWDSIKDSANPADFEAYLEQYPKGRFARLARNRLGSGGGSDETSGGAAAPGVPVMVKLPSLGIEMGKYEVTQGEWRAVMGNNPSGFSGCDDCPVEQVSWNDTQEYLVRLNQQTGKDYRLPTEQEWYAACQAGGRSEYCGSDNIFAVAWFDGNSGNTTHPVGQKQPNGWGLYDMSGNVFEWTDSCWDGDCRRRVLRGGSWLAEPASVRAAIRSFDLTGGVTNSNFGFRVARTLR